MSTPSERKSIVHNISLYHIAAELRLANEALVSLFALHLDTAPDREKYTGAIELFKQLNKRNAKLSNRLDTLYKLLSEPTEE